MPDSYEEVSARGNELFVPPASSRLQAAPADMAKALGIDLEEQTEPEPSVDLAEEQKANEEAAKIIENRSAKIQETTEKLYQIEERAALKDPSHLQELIASKDPLDRKNAEKILKRNAEQFGANSIEDYKVILAKNSSSDPLEQKLAVQDAEIASLKQKTKDSDWSQWKKDNSIGNDLDTVADEILATYPTMSYGDIIAMARGRLGLTQTSNKKAQGSTAVGSSSAPETEEGVYTSPLAKRLLKNPESTLKFAKGYLRTL